jgi:hypothetical protein
MKFHSDYLNFSIDCQVMEKMAGASTFQNNDCKTNRRLFDKSFQSEDEEKGVWKFSKGSPLQQAPSPYHKLNDEPSFLNVELKEELTGPSPSMECDDQKQQLRKPTSKPRQMLSLRSDVMNKNLFRAIRRECKGMFWQYLDSNNLSNSKKQKHFLPNLEQFSEYLLSETHVDWDNISEFNTKEFSTYLGIFSNY